MFLFQGVNRSIIPVDDVVEGETMSSFCIGKKGLGCCRCVVKGAFPTVLVS